MIVNLGIKAPFGEGHKREFNRKHLQIRCFNLIQLLSVCVYTCMSIWKLEVKPKSRSSGTIHSVFPERASHWDLGFIDQVRLAGQ